MHAAGVVISDVSLNNLMPLYKSNGVILTGYSMEYIELPALHFRQLQKDSRATVPHVRPVFADKQRRTDNRFRVPERHRHVFTERLKAVTPKKYRHPVFHARALPVKSSP